MKTSSSWSIVAALAVPAMAVPHNPWEAFAHKPGFMPKYYNADGWKGWGAGWETGQTAGTSSASSTSRPTNSTLPATLSSSSPAIIPISTTSTPSILVTPSPTTYTVVNTHTLTVEGCPSWARDCPEEQKTTFTTTVTNPSQVVTDTVYVTITDVQTMTDVETTVVAGPGSTVIILETETDYITTSCTTGWGIMTTQTFDSTKSQITSFSVADTSRSIPEMPSSSSAESSVIVQPWKSSSSIPWSSRPSQWTGSSWDSAPSPTATGAVPSISPGFASACIRVPIPGCKPCDGFPGSDPDEYCGLTMETDYYETWPQTCMKVICHFTVSDLIISPDGVERQAMVLNKKLPGDMIEAWWGDLVEVHLTNNLTTNGTSLHFHGLRQLNTNEMDGVPSITQCPVPGNNATITYTFVATQYGHTWTHSHYSLQTWEGVYAPFVIHGPTTWDYDYDLGPVLLSDWLHTPVFSQFELVERTGSPDQDNVLINGVGVYSANASDSSIPLTGSRAHITFDPGKKHRLQLVCTALDSHFAFSIDNHIITVMGIDFVPIHPYTTSVLKIGIGQRYDIVIEANQPISSYWLRVDALDLSVAPGQAPPCGASNKMANHTMAIVSYIGAPNTASDPTTSPYPHDTVCEDEPYDLLVPWLAKNVGKVSETVSKDLVITQDASTKIYRWYLSGTTFQMDYRHPTLLSMVDNSTTYEGPLALEVDVPGDWVYVVIETPVALSHPIHLHGHDFYVLAAGSGTYTNQTLNVANPPRRDVATLPIAGYLVLAFVADNPGAWLMHCHIGWHVSMGFALQIIETPDLTRKSVMDVSLTENCAAWTVWDDVAGVLEIDSGV